MNGINKVEQFSSHIVSPAEESSLPPRNIEGLGEGSSFEANTGSLGAEVFNATPFPVVQGQTETDLPVEGVEDATPIPNSCGYLINPKLNESSTIQEEAIAKKGRNEKISVD